MRLYYLIGRLLHPFAIVGFYVFSILTKTPRVRVMVWNEKGELLLVQTWLSGDTWGLPGGGVHRNEPFEQAVQRELREETGIDAKFGELRRIAELHSRGHQEIIFSLSASSSSLPAILPDKFEVKAAGWFLPENLPKLDTLAHGIVGRVAQSP